tara:strand:- start:1499 stop:2140 length:642 start_codon:yes stop_codon:yes gene_type:complete
MLEDLINKKKIFIFDFDGVIVDSNRIKAINFYKIFETRNNFLKKKIIDYHNNNIGENRAKKINYFINNFSELKDFTLKKQLLLNRFSYQCVNDISICKEIPGAYKFLQILKKQKSKMILCSATPINELKKILGNRKLDKFFDIICGYPNKKDEFISNLIIKKKYNKTQIVYFGDSNSDYLAAKKNNIDFIHVNSNKNFHYKNKEIITINDFNL